MHILIYVRRKVQKALELIFLSEDGHCPAVVRMELP